MQLPLSLVVITKNEEKNLSRCLKSVEGLSDIVVVDSDSTDRTCEFAQKMGARVLKKDWMGFGKQKRYAVEQAKNDWVLCLDADEALSDSLKSEIQNIFSQLDPGTGYLLPRKSFHLGRWIGHGGWYPDYQLRLFNRKHLQWNEEPIHEKVVATKTAALKNPILHYLFEDLRDQIETNNRYSSLLAEKDFKNGKKFSFLKLLIKPKVKFLECYVLKLGFLDGLPGFIIAVGAAYSIFLRWAKLWELESVSAKQKESA